MFKIILFVLLMLLYPWFLQQLQISGLRAVPLIIPYALGMLSLIVIGTEITRYLRRRKRD